MSKSKAITKLPTLEDCALGLHEQWKAIHVLARKTKYRTIAVGLWLLKAQQVLKVKPGPKEFSPTVGENSAEAGFDAWLTSAGADLGFSRASGYNWLNAAINAGLTPDSTLEDVEALEKKDALADRKLSAHDLYAPPRLEGASDPDATARVHNERRPESRAQQTWFPFYEQLATYGSEEKEAELLHHLPLISTDPTKVVSLQDLETHLENTLAKVREIKAAKEASERTSRRGRGRILDADTGEDAA